MQIIVHNCHTLSRTKYFSVQFLRMFLCFHLYTERVQCLIMDIIYFITITLKQIMSLLLWKNFCRCFIVKLIHLEVLMFCHNLMFLFFCNDNLSAAGENENGLVLALLRRDG